MEIVKVCSRKKVSKQFVKSSFAPGCRSNCNHHARRIFITCDIEGSQLVVQLVCLLLAEQRRKLEYENDNNSCCQFKEIHKIKDKASFYLLSPLEVWVECGAELQFKQPGKICCQDLHNKQNGVRENNKICLLLNLQRNIISLHCLHCIVSNALLWQFGYMALGLGWNGMIGWGEWYEGMGHTLRGALLF